MLSKHFSSYIQIRPFLIMLCAFLSLLVGGYALFLYLRTDRLMLERLHEQATAYYDLVIHAKEWNSGYGGVYVLKQDGVETNHYLRRMGIDPDVHDVAGRVFTLRNHAIMTAEISRMCEREKGAKFRMISLAPIDPANTPDNLELRVIRGFIAGEREFARLEEGLSPPAYRYIRPLYVDQSCLLCHRSQGYAIGDVIGAISISLPVSNVLAENRISRILIIFGAVMTIVIVLTGTYFFSCRLVVKLDEVQSHLVLQATTDELTGLMNRRNILRRLDEEQQRAIRLREDLCIMIIDLDHFKRINDTYGHICGDVVLKSAAASIRDTIRTYDIVGRIGGEEFLIISPGVPMEEAINLAERIRRLISELEIEQGEQKIGVTVSAGVTTLEADDTGVVEMMMRADRALYMAKEQGRNRVVAL
jgi:diguanylate cyclase (GGDEF)-like protein